MDPKFNAIVGLYQAMPGAPPPPTENGVTQWNAVDGNQHWAFCKTIIDFVEATVDQTCTAPDEGQIRRFFTDLLNEARPLSPGEAFTLYGPKAVTTHPDYARIHSELGIHVFGKPEQGQADRWQFTIIKGAK